MKINVRKLIPCIIAASALTFVGGILILIFGIAAAGSSLTKVLVAIEGVLAMLIGLILAYVVLLARDNDANFFLYDRRTSKNIKPEELTFERINSRMGYYMSLISSSQEQMWQKNVLGRENDRFGPNDVYKPLAAYKMLYDLSELDRMESWVLFNEADAEVIGSLTAALKMNGEEEMCRTLQFLYDEAMGPEDVERVRDFVMGNAKYLRRRMQKYILDNIEWFY
ncbi:MAG: hypothetical protein E7589_07295 [Ruminococcaceae bacterium]|nr:hypothetical protein [Oscillospiraceae bacterium]